MNYAATEINIYISVPLYFGKILCIYNFLYVNSLLGVGIIVFFICFLPYPFLF